MNQNQPPRRPVQGNRPQQGQAQRPSQGTRPQQGQGTRPQGAGRGLGRPVRRAGAPTPPRRPTPPRPQPASRPLIHPARTARRRRRKTTILAILVTVALTVLLLVGMIFGELISAIGTLIDRTGRPDTDSETTTTAADVGGTVDPAVSSASGGGTPDPITPAAMAMTTLNQTRADIATGELLLIDADHAYVFPDHTPSTLVNLFDNRPYVTTESGNRVRAYQVRNTEQMLDRITLEALGKMMTDFYGEYKITDLLVTWGYRSLEEQKNLYALYVADYPGYSEAQIEKLLRDQVDTPGYSEHHLGTGVDIKIYTDSGVTETLDDEPAYFFWMRENAPKYGFIHRYPAEKKAVTGVGYDPYHFRYVGTPHATYIHENGLCFEEYLDELRTATSPDGKHLTVEVDGEGSYEVYYVKATGETTAVPVPKDYPYTVSGDNAEGFIVTVTLN